MLMIRIFIGTILGLIAIGVLGVIVPSEDLPPDIQPMAALATVTPTASPTNTATVRPTNTPTATSSPTITPTPTAKATLCPYLNAITAEGKPYCVNDECAALCHTTRFPTPEVKN